MRTAKKGRTRKYADNVVRLEVREVAGLLEEAQSTRRLVAGRWIPSRLDNRLKPAIDRSRMYGFSVAVSPFGDVQYCYLYTSGVQRKRRHKVLGVVRAVRVPCAVGGSRWLFVCPDTGVHVRALYFSKSRSRGERFVSMKAAGLSYRTQSADKTERLARKAERIASALPDGVNVRPAGMHQKTYDKKIKALEDIVAASVGTASAQ